MIFKDLIPRSLRYSSVGKLVFMKTRGRIESEYGRIELDLLHSKATEVNSLQHSVISGEVDKPRMVPQGVGHHVERFKPHLLESFFEAVSTHTKEQNFIPVLQIL